LEEGRNKLEDGNKDGLIYKSGMIGPNASIADKNKEGRERVNNKLVACCSLCKSATHPRRTSKLCALNPNNLAAKEKVYEIAKLCAKVSV
jgi:hypothetical protein